MEHFLDKGERRNSICALMSPSQLINRCYRRPQDSVFWSEHNYGPNTPYFSYLHKLGDRSRSRLDALIGYLHDEAVKHFPAAKKAKCVESLILKA